MLSEPRARSRPADWSGISTAPGRLPRRRSLHPGQALSHPERSESTGVACYPGEAVNVIAWAGLRIAVVVCLDVEFTSLWARPATFDLDLILVPVKTDMVSGYY